MKKLLLLVATALLGLNAFAGEQGDDNGFGIKLFAGFAGDKFGTVELETNIAGSSIKKEVEDLPGLHKTPSLGLALDSRWYVANPGSFGIAIDARWIDFSFAHKEWDYIFSKKNFGTYNNNFIKIGVTGPGVIGTYYLNDKMAVDVFYNFVPTMSIASAYQEFNSEYLENHTNVEDEEKDHTFGFGINHYMGAAFRYKVFQVGLEYNIAKMKAMDWGKDDAESEIFDLYIQKYNLNNLRVFLGFKF